MGWWLALALVVAALLLLAVVLGSVRRRVAELQRVAVLAQERTGGTQRRLQERAQRLQADVADLQRETARRMGTTRR